MDYPEQVAAMLSEALTAVGLTFQKGVFEGSRAAFISGR